MKIFTHEANMHGVESGTSIQVIPETHHHLLEMTVMTVMVMRPHLLLVPLTILR